MDGRSDLADALAVDRNTVPAAYRRLRDDGVLEFRRGRGTRVASAARPGPPSNKPSATSSNSRAIRATRTPA